MAERALITGATAGLGAEFAQQLAQAHTDLVLVARDRSKLDAKAARLQQEYGIQVETIPADLLTEAGIIAVVDRLADAAAPVSILVNNAGFGLVKPFEQNSLAEEFDHLQIHVKTPMVLMHAALPGMLTRRGGRIINVASVAGFIPRGTYGAGKSWLISFSRWANVHYGDRGISVTAVCPGFVHTEFHQRMDASTAGIAPWMWLDADQVVREGLKDSAGRKSVSIPSFKYKAMVLLSKFSSDKLAALAGKRGR